MRAEADPGTGARAPGPVGPHTPLADSARAAPAPASAAEAAGPCPSPLARRPVRSGCAKTDDAPSDCAGTGATLPLAAPGPGLLRFCPVLGRSEPGPPGSGPGCLDR